MIKSLLDSILKVFNAKTHPPIITERSSLREITLHYPNLSKVIQSRFAIRVESADLDRSLRTFCERRHLPPAQIVFMEIQMDARVQGIDSLSPTQVKHLLDQYPRLKVLDVREAWEREICRLPDSLPLDTFLWDEILTQWSREESILVYCHFGIKSLDAASYLADRGFKKVYTLKGGIDAWALEAGGQFPRYENAWC